MAYVTPPPAAAPSTSGGLLSGVSGVAGALAPWAGLIGGATQALGQALGGNAESGTKGDAKFGGINVGSKVVGSGTATTIPAPETPTQAKLYSQIAPVGAGSVSANWIPLAGIAAAAVLLFALITGGSRPRRKRKGK